MKWLLLTLIPSLLLAFSGSGSGTEADPYQITTINQLQEMNNALSAHYRLMNDIDASKTATWNVGDHDNDAATLDVAMGFKPVGQGGNRFKGTLNGSGFKITNLSINRPKENHVGLFGNANGAVISDLGLVENNITGAQMVGGIAGNAYATSVSRCFTTGTVTVGGLVGYNNGLSSVKNCYATGAVSGIGSVGGVVGQNTALEKNEVVNCYATGAVTGTGNTGGLVGKNDSLTVANSFWNSETSGQSTNSGGTGKTTAEMQTVTTFTDAGWDFVGETSNGTSGIWVFLPDNYPRLKWETTFPKKGSGSEVNPYQITTVGELQAMKYDLAGNYRLMNDIDARETSSWNGGNGFVPIGTYSKYFTGSLNGGGHRVTGLSITDMALSCAGLIGAADGAQFDSLGVEGTYAAGDNVGGIVGYAHTNTRISNCYSEVHIFADGKIGGIVGAMFDKDTVINCYAAGSITANSSNVGGLVGLISVGEVINSYSVSTLSGGTNRRGLIGNPNIVVPENCFWDSTVCGKTSGDDVGTALGTGEMKIGTTFTTAGWDFIDEIDNGTGDIWVIDTDDDYPKLAWSVKKLSYTAGSNGSVDDTLQYLFSRSDGSAVTAAVNSGYFFRKWSDDSTENPRTDLSVTENISVIAEFGQILIAHDTLNTVTTVGSVELSRDSAIAPKTDTIVTIVTEITTTDSLWIRTDSLADGNSLWDSTMIVVNVRSKEQISFDTLKYVPVNTVAIDTLHRVTTVDSLELSRDSVIAPKTDTIVTIETEITTTDSLWIKTDSLADGMSFWDTTVIRVNSSIEKITTFDTLKYVPTVTTPQKSDTISTLIKADSVEIDSALFGSTGEEDTVVTTTQISLYSDSLFTITDSLSDGVWFNADTLFKSEEFRNDTIGVKVDTLKYQGGAVAIIITDSKSKSTVSPLIVSPNPVAQTEEGVNLIIPSQLSGHWKVIISDALGNCMDEAEFEAVGGTTYRWDLHSRYGARVAGGSYLLTAQFTDREGGTQIFRRMIGVRQ